MNVLNQVIKKDYALYQGDCIEVMKDIPDNSMHYSIFSPPFASLYTYSDSIRDMGNCKDDSVFMNHFDFFVKELHRIIMPGRIVSVHCANLPTFKQRHGYIGLRDFRGDIIRLFQKYNWIYHSEVTIWKNPATEMQRTKALGLLHKQLKKDSCMSKQGNPDYLVSFRKPGINSELVTKDTKSFPVELWRKWASPIFEIQDSKDDFGKEEQDNFYKWWYHDYWMDINQSDTLQYRSARDHKDERHICPLQLEVIRRGIILWTNPNDIVFSPFMGIGSEGYIAIQENRKFVGIELKESYYKQAEKNIKNISIKSFL